MFRVYFNLTSGKVKSKIIGYVKLKMGTIFTTGNKKSHPCYSGMAILGLGDSSHGY
jgi:hypothetical protein